MQILSLKKAKGFRMLKDLEDEEKFCMDIFNLNIDHLQNIFQHGKWFLCIMLQHRELAQRENYAASQ